MRYGAAVIAAALVYYYYKRNYTGVTYYWNEKCEKIHKIVELFLKKHPGYLPCWYLVNGHVQTMVSIVFSVFSKKVKYRREIVQVEAASKKHLPGILGIDWIDTVTKPNLELKGDDVASKGLVIIVPGLTGSSQSEYVKTFALKFFKQSYDIVVVNYRASAGVDAINGQAYCGAYTEDVRQSVIHVLKQYKEKFNDVPVNTFIIGFSLGANILSKYLAEEGSRLKGVITGAACLGSPFDLLLSSKLMHMSWLRTYLYSISLTKRCCDMIRKRQKSFFGDGNHHGVNLQDLKKIKTLRDLDSKITAKVFGYRSCDEYYRDGSTAHRLHEIGIPTLMVSSLDDPVCDKAAIPFEEVPQTENVVLAVTKCGGHGMEWFSGPLFPKSWSVELVDVYFKGVLSLKNEQFTPTPSSIVRFG
jgi:predicted alpha/beta-fold hydrolase